VTAGASGAPEPSRSAPPARSSITPDVALPSRPSPGASANAPAIRLTASLERACLTAGQTQTVRANVSPVRRDKDAVVGFLATYSDGKSGNADMGSYGGNAGGFADGKGNWSSTWTVASNAPAGPVDVLVVARNAGHEERVTVTFTVAGLGGC
jgi:hypothetical protein